MKDLFNDFWGAIKRLFHIGRKAVQEEIEEAKEDILAALDKELEELEQQIEGATGEALEVLKARVALINTKILRIMRNIDK